MMRRLLPTLVFCIVIALGLPLRVLADAAADRHAVLFDTNYYDTVETNTCSPGGGTAPATGSPTDVQVRNAKIVIGIAKTDNVGKQGALIGLMVALAESTLTNLANTNVPLSQSNPAKEGNGSDHDSVGVFQQRPSTGWSTIATGQAALTNQGAIYQLMTPAYAAQAFFGSPPGSNAPGALSKGLQNKSGWQQLPPQQAAQQVQASGTPDGSNYLKQAPTAQGYVDKYYDSAPAIPLPVAVTGGTSNGGGAGPTGGCIGEAGNSTITGCVNPITNKGWRPARTDQGIDYAEDSKISVVAICDGTIISTDGAGWPGGVFIVIKMSSGPFIGKCTFVAEHLTNVAAVGTKVTAGQQIAETLPGYPWTEWGWASGPQTPASRYNGAVDGTPTAGGLAFTRFIKALGAQTLQDPGPGPMYAGDSCP